MPWTTSDVSKFKKGLSTEQKKKWVSIANSVLRECRRKNEGNCEQKAIRTANSRVNTNVSVASLNKNKNFADMETQEHTLIIHSVDTATYPIRMETSQNRQYMVVPVVMMVEGVHNGSRGPLLHSAQALERSANSWNGVPVVVNHPQKNGQYVSANTSDQQQNHVGKVFNTHMDGNKLKGEAWIDVQKIAAISPEALSSIQDQHPLDVSIGSYTTEQEEEGDWNGEHYRAVAVNHYPDHLALLPYEQGACSWADGCGVRVNSQNSDNMADQTEKTQFQIYKDLNKDGLALVPVVNETGFAETLSKVSTYLDSMDNDMRMHFLEELYDDRVIYRVRNRESGSSTLYQQNYSIGEDGKVEFNGDPKEVRKEVSYQTMSSGKFRRTKFNNNKSNGMSTEEVSKKVDALIANTNSKFTNCDRDWLESLTVDKLNELMPKKEEPKQEPQMDVNKAIEFLKANPPKEEEVLELLSDEAKEAHKQGVQLYQEKKDKMVKAITANSSAWTEEELKGMDFSLLEKISKSVKPDANYSGQGAGGELETNTEGDDEFLPVTPLQKESK
ncbi:MAG: DUF2213 domain-containing protein [Bacteroidales bacterium]